MGRTCPCDIRPVRVRQRPRALPCADGGDGRCRHRDAAAERRGPTSSGAARRFDGDDDGRRVRGRGDGAVAEDGVGEDATSAPGHATQHPSSPSEQPGASDGDGVIHGAGGVQPGDGGAGAGLLRRDGWYESAGEQSNANRSSSVASSGARTSCAAPRNGAVPGGDAQVYAAAGSGSVSARTLRAGAAKD